MYLLLEIWIYVCLFVFWPCCMVCGVLVAQPGIEPRPSAVREWIPNPWATRGFPKYGYEHQEKCWKWLSHFQNQDTAVFARKFTVLFSFFKLRMYMDFFGGPVVENPPGQCRGHGFDLWSGKIPQATEQLSPCATTADAQTPIACAPQQEKPQQWEARTWQLEKAFAAMKTQSATENE